jgi:predicted acylesterase/phospholipase RssA
MVKKVLVIPGGGVFGMIPAGLLASFNPAGVVHNHIDAIGGTSVGGILALLYGRAMTYGDVYEKMRDAMPKVFKSKWWDAFGIFGPKHDAGALRGFLQEHLDIPFGMLTPMLVVTSIDFSDGKANAYIDGGLFENMPLMTTTTAIKSKLGVPFNAMDIFVIGTGYRKNHSKVKVFDNLVRRDDVDIKAWEVAMATSAAPTYFEPFSPEGKTPMSKWGLKSWGGPLVNMLTEANEMSSQFWILQCAVRNLTVFNPVELDEKWKMNDPSLVPVLSKKVDAVQEEFNHLFAKWLKAT